MKEIRETARGLQWGRCWREGIAIKIEKERERKLEEEKTRGASGGGGVRAPRLFLSVALI